MTVALAQTYEAPCGDRLDSAVYLHGDFDPAIAVRAAVPGSYPHDAAFCLSKVERAKAARFRSSETRALYETAHVLLRQSLSRFAPLPPEAWRFGATPLGKPFVANSGFEDLRFSLTHTTGLAVCAIRKGKPLGVDAEGPRPIPDLDRLSRSVLTEDEFCRLRAGATPQDRCRRFLQLWTLKEAYAKALGLGLSLPFRSFAVEPLGGERWRPVGQDTRACGLNLLATRSGHAVALAW